MSRSAPDLEIVYVGDPMCSWCWGFAPAVRALERHFTVPLSVMVGGLRPGPAAGAVDEATRRTLAHHWDEVATASGQPFDRAMLDRPGFVYDTEVPDRSVVAARRLAPGRTIDWFERLQQAFYAENTDITDPTTWPALVDDVNAAGSPPGDDGPLDVDELIAATFSEEVGRAAWSEFDTVAGWGITGFPTLLLREGTQMGLLCRGWVPTAALLEGLERHLRDRHGDAVVDGLLTAEGRGPAGPAPEDSASP